MTFSIFLQGGFYIGWATQKGGIQKVVAVNKALIYRKARYLKISSFSTLLYDGVNFNTIIIYVDGYNLITLDKDSANFITIVLNKRHSFIEIVSYSLIVKVRRCEHLYYDIILIEGLKVVFNKDVSKLHLKTILCHIREKFSNFFYTLGCQMDQDNPLVEPIFYLLVHIFLPFIYKTSIGSISLLHLIIYFAFCLFIYIVNSYKTD